MKKQVEAPAKKTTPKKEPAKSAAKGPAKSPAERAPAQPRLKDPKGGLTAAGRKEFAERDGSQLRPGVKGPADTPDKMKRKGSFLTRHFTNPRGPMVREGEPTRLALSAHAWGEPVPKTEAEAKQLAAKGRKLLEQYHAAVEATGGKAKTANTGGKAKARSSGGRAASKTSARKAAAKRAGR
ncbi:DUF6321 domain-containing protein [Acidipila sp. EB88]|uniref:DUF6321 domain-containing protein n=1 Tax=Acidipila sp. EB88 TaxID=2305226 RepID=UPI0018F68861|nr:DUF6321 domain-containing protein [Acidipila sp. EB88]